MEIIWQITLVQGYDMERILTGALTINKANKRTASLSGADD
jgi:hypothetical protein